MKNTPVLSRLHNWKLASATALLGICTITAGCGNALSSEKCINCGPGTPVPSGPFTLTVGASDSIMAAVPITASPVDANATGGGNAGGVLTPLPVPTPTTLPAPNTETCQSSAATCTVFTLNYASGTLVQLTAPPTTQSPANYASTANGAPNPPATEVFSKWVGCQSSVANICTINVESNSYVEAVYTSQATVTLSAASGLQQLVGTSQQLYLGVTGNIPDQTAYYTILGPPGYTGDLGVVNSMGFYESPYPAPAYVVIIATSNYDPVATATVVIQLGSPAETIGPALTVDTSAVTRTISPLIYGVNGLGSSETSLGAFVPTVDRWGGYTASRYNYLLDLTNTGGANNQFYETVANTNTAFPDTSAVNSQITLDQSGKIASVITVPMLGYVTQSPDSTKRGFACAFSIAKYGAQTGDDSNHPDCGNGDSAVNTNQYVNWANTPITIGTGGSAITVSNGPEQITSPSDTSVAADQTFDAGWVNYLVGKFGNAASGGVAMYELDNEPEYWFYNHNDLHPTWTTYDDITNRGITYATAIKAADPTASIGGPTISGYYYYTDSLADQYLGYYGQGPADKNSHNGTPFLQYYLQQMQSASTTAGVRLLDYLDVHANQFTSGSGSPAGDTSVQEAREDSVRLFYDSSYSSNGNTYNLIPYLQGLESAYYPGTKTAITDYSFGGEESISGAIAQAEAMAVFGAYGLDLATMTSSQGPLTSSAYVPMQTAFNFFLNYDGAGSKFGDESLATTSVLTGVDANGNPVVTTGISQISAYAAKRSSDGAVTVLLFNKTYQTESTSLALTDASTSAKVFQYSVPNLSAITPLSDATVTAGSGTTPASVSLTLPAQSITLLVFPQ